MRLQENGEVWVSWFVGYFIRIISSVGYHPKYSERWGVNDDGIITTFSKTSQHHYFCSTSDEANASWHHGGALGLRPRVRLLVV